MLLETSIHDLLVSLEKMSDYDIILRELDIMKADINEELVKLNILEPEKPLSVISGDDRLSGGESNSKAPSRMVSP